MKMSKVVVAALLLGSLTAVVVAGCKEEGPAERAGKEMDRSAEKAGRELEKAGRELEKAGEKMKDAFGGMGS